MSNVENVSNINNDTCAPQSLSNTSYSNGLEEPMTPATKLSKQLELAFFISARTQASSNFYDAKILSSDTIPNSTNSPPASSQSSSFEKGRSLQLAKLEFERECSKVKVGSVASPCSNELRPVFENPSGDSSISTSDHSNKTSIIKTILNSAIVKRDSKMKKQRKMGNLNRRPVWRVAASQVPLLTDNHTSNIV